MNDILLPRTDAGAVVQLVILVAVYVVGAVLLRRQKDWLLLLTGATVLTLALFGVRALH